MKKHHLHGLMLISVLLCVAQLSCQRKELLEAPRPLIDPWPIALPQVAAQADPMAEKQWALNTLAASKTWENYQGSRAVKVMLIGTGIDYNHPDLRANVFVNQAEYNAYEPDNATSLNYLDDDDDGLVDNIVGWDFIDNDGLAFDRFGFDTALAGIVGAVHDNGVGIKGVAPKVSLYPVRVIDANGLTSLPLLLRALRHALTVKPHVVLLNLAVQKFSRKSRVARIEKQGLQQVLQELHAAQIPVVVGAGNLSSSFQSQGHSVRNEMTKYDNIFVVTSIDLEAQKPELANFSPMHVHTSAPGDQILTTAKNGGYRVIGSTHAAAAYVAGALALAIAEYEGQKTYRDYFNAMISSQGSQVQPGMSAYTLGRNSLHLARFMQALTLQ